MKWQLLICSGVLLSLLAAPVAQAALEVNGWTLQIDGWTFDLSNVAGQGLQGTFSGVNQITDTGLFHNTLYDRTTKTIKTTAPAVGDYYVTDGLMRAAGLTGATSTTVSAVPSGGTPAVLNGPSPAGAGASSFEMTLSFSIASRITNIAAVPGGLNISASPITGPAASPLSSNYLDVYIDNLNDGTGSRSNVDILSGGGTGGDGFQDGTKIATFRLSAAGGDGEVLNTATLTGDLRSTFSLFSGSPGVLFDKYGSDLSWLPRGTVQLAMHSILNMDPDQNGAADSGPPQNWPFAAQSAEPFSSFFGTDPDNVNPEPTTILIWCGLFLLLAPLLLRRKRQ